MSQYGLPQAVIDAKRKQAAFENQINDPHRTRFYTVSMITGAAALLLSILALRRR